MPKEFLGYLVHENGTIFNKKGRQISQRVTEHGYKIVNFGKKNYKVHRLVALVFIGQCRPGYQVNHIDGNKLNNHRSNLEYISKSKNQLHRRHTLGKSGTTKPRMVQAVKDDDVIRFSSIRNAHVILRISYTCIKQCCEGIRKTAGGYTFSYYETSIPQNPSIEGEQGTLGSNQ